MTVTADRSGYHARTFAPLAEVNRPEPEPLEPSITQRLAHLREKRNRLDLREARAMNERDWETAAATVRHTQTLSAEIVALEVHLIRLRAQETSESIPLETR